MAENPATWGLVEKTIYEALKQQEENKKQFKAGYSTPKFIAEALRREGLINEP